ncbi:sulfite exporter TauE/SafE family protein [Tichowtungia aerotolerans]|uniref:Probable membrane transporter protein n=1 Tax=Tichowtungia aerotolerans TaxID=2697043 RepID=A0A6P1M6B5_9BACT|nr:sulfite exporter TauE/SafE family protein [Tichowtungia aerotolerans]QHI68144.1 TSUP family transporter [Tichowtungia aerotolerans]
MNVWSYPLFIAGGFLAGFINTLAGSGSVVSLAIMNLMGLPLDVANGTKRVAILLQAAVGTARFKKQGNLQLREHIGIVLPAVAGAVLGAFLAGNVSEHFFRRSVGICMVLILGLLFFKPQRWLEGNSLKKQAGPVRRISFFLVGIYGGYIQVGVGVFLLTALVLGEGLDLVRGNAVKVFLALCFTVPALLIFLINGLVRWDAAIPLAIGSMLGAWAATHEAAKHGARFIRWLLIVVVTLSAVRYLFF